MHRFPRQPQRLAQSIRAASWLFAGLAALPAPAVFAAGTGEQEATLQAVTVTATRREESL